MAVKKKKYALTAQSVSSGSPFEVKPVFSRISKPNSLVTSFVANASPFAAKPMLTIAEPGLTAQSFANDSPTLDKRPAMT
jgi:hypothetical protein